MNYTTWKDRSNRKPILRETIDCTVNPGIIIGKGGKTIQAIQNKSNTRIKIFRDKKIILITAYEQQFIDLAKVEIEKICENKEYNYENDYENDYEEQSNKVDFLSPDNFPAFGKMTEKKDIGIWGNLQKIN